MQKIKLTKKSLREEQAKLKQLESYLPTLQLKKKLLQFEVNNCYFNLDIFNKNMQKTKTEVEEFAFLLSDDSSRINDFLQIESVQKAYENIAGVEIPKFESITYVGNSYHLFDTPVWMETALFFMKQMIEIKERINTENEKKAALSKELKEVSIRVNLFEKILIPRTIKNIKRIQIFLNDQELAAISQAKVAKQKKLMKND